MRKNEKRIKTLEKQIAKIKEKNSDIGDLRSGSLLEQYNVCGTAECKCKTSPPNFTKNGRSSMKFVNRKDAKDVKIQVNNYTRLRKLIALWVELGTELSELRINQEE